MFITFETIWNFLRNDYVQLLMILLGSLLVAKIIKEIIVKVLKKLMDKTKSDLDNMIVDVISRPLYLTTLIAGLQIALYQLSYIEQFKYIANPIFFIIYVLIGTSIVAKIFTALVTRWLKVKKQFDATPNLISKMATFTIYIIAILIVMEYFQVEIGPLIATLGIGGLAIGLALQSTLANFFAGIHIISDEPVKVGDYIEVASGVEGTVVDIGWRSTKLKTLGKTMIIIPNSKLSESIIKNLSTGDHSVTAKVEVGVDYRSNLNKVEKTAQEVADKIQDKTAGAVKKFKPTVRFTNFGESNINFVIYMRAESREMKAKDEHACIKALKKRFDDEKIEMSWPIRKIYNMQ